MLIRDLSQTGLTECLSLVSVSAVELDCQGHAMSSLSVRQVSSVSIANCTVTGQLTLFNASSVTVTNSNLQGGTTVANGSGVVVTSSTISAPPGAAFAINFAMGQGDQPVKDTVTFNATGGAEAVNFSNGTGNEVIRNSITGAYGGSTAKTGSDDGILLVNEQGDEIQGNTISGFYDAAIEGVGTLAQVTIAANTISTIGTTAVGAYSCTSWTGNTIQGNSVSQTPSLALINYQTAASECGMTPFPRPVFANNHFIGNRYGQPGIGLGYVNVPRMTVNFSTGIVTDNVLQNNDFGSNDGPFLSPLSGSSMAVGTSAVPWIR